MRRVCLVFAVVSPSVLVGCVDDDVEGVWWLLELVLLKIDSLASNLPEGHVAELFVGIPFFLCLGCVEEYKIGYGQVQGSHG